VEAPRSTFQESMPLKRFLNYLRLMTNIIEEATNKELWRKSMLKDDAWDILAKVKGEANYIRFS